ncbi:hypothetical protein [Sporobacter termitidis]|uniref:hypothetical protein n=1 Tax=Sporobacter termitidis TaxID=44749 RepID=UPI0011600F3B|nr:hypothetical protein [Sporobacter termitidis]
MKIYKSDQVMMIGKSEPKPTRLRIIKAEKAPPLMLEPSKAAMTRNIDKPIIGQKVRIVNENL